jgi:hypothetical protein
MMRAMAVLGWVCLGVGTAVAAEAEVRVPAGSKPAPKWAVAELEMLDAQSTCYHTLLDKFEGKLNIPRVKQLMDHGGCDDDWAEGIAIWDLYLLNRYDPRVQKAYIHMWNAIFQERRMPGRNPFWCTGGFDAEHYSELFQLLWGCIELDPTNKKLIADNKRCLDFIMKEVYDPKTRLMKSSFHLRGKLDRKPGEVALNTIWLTAAFHAYLTTGDERYKKWAMEYGTSWNELAKANDGAFPYYVPPGTRTLAATWHMPPWGGFGYGKYGIIAGMRSLHSLPTTLCLLDKGDLRHRAGMLSMIQVLFARGRDGLPAGFHDGKDFVRGERGNWAVPRLMDNTYALAFDPGLEKRYRAYISAAAKSKDAGTERHFMQYPAFYYFGIGTRDEVAAYFRHRARRIREKTALYRKRPAPRKGDHVREQYTPYVSGMEYVIGSWWGRYDNGRCGGPVPGSVRYFTGDGAVGLPPDIAALVTKVAKDQVAMQLHNRAKTPTTLVITAGWYGQHRWTSVQVNDGEPGKLNSRRARVALAPGATGTLTFGIERFANEPSLRPQAAEGDKPAR